MGDEGELLALYRPYWVEAEELQQEVTIDLVLSEVLANGTITADLDLPIDLEEEISTIVPKEVLKQRVITRNSVAIPQVLVKWRNQPLSEATWEDEASGIKMLSQAVVALWEIMIHEGIERS
ncbi:hypothetical protein L6164_028424 [Bauhinia variegata]|uniref:Uncharacterized protein n=1 Tax=Bauhinia variegata TaxID=167791 RepID=A0ACB9L655_BAUVA|nr:hypothetical protein L6164_028424 [Bauhinia variegata]